MKTAPTMQLNRDSDEVYKNTMEVVKAVLGMNSITMDAKAEDLFNSVKVSVRRWLFQMSRLR